MRKTYLLISLVVTALVIAACGGGGGDATTPPANPTTGGPAATSRPAATQPPAPTSTAVQVSSGQIKFALGFLGTWALLPAASISMNRTGIDPMYDALIAIDKQEQPTGETGVISSWQLGSNGTALTLKMRDGVVFHDGTKATAADIKASLEWFASPDAMYRVANNPRSNEVASIETPDANTAVLNFKRPEVFGIKEHLTLTGFGAGDGYLISKAYMDKVTFKEYNIKPLGSGPYRYKSDVLNQEINYEAAASPHWLYGVPKYKELKILVIAEDATRTALLQSGGAEVISVPRARISAFRSQYDIQTKQQYKVAWASFTGIWVEKFDNGVKNPFYDPRVRRAFSLAIDRQEIVDAFLYGMGTPIMTRWIPPGDAGYKEYPLEKPDLVKAKALLAEAGYPNGFEMDMTISGGGADLTVEGPQINEALAKYYEKLGVKVNRVAAKPGAIQAANTIAKNYTLPTAGGPGWGVTYGLIRGLEPGAKIQDQLSRGWEDQDLVEQQYKIGVANNMQEYVAAAQEFQRIALEKMIQVALFQGGAEYGAKKGIGGDRWHLGKSYHHINFVGLATGKVDTVR